MLFTFHVFQYIFELGQLVGNLFQKWNNLDTKRVVRKWAICKTWLIYMPPVLVNLQIHLVQGGEDAYNALSRRSLFAKEPLMIGLFYGKWPIKMKHPMGLRHPVASWLLRIVNSSIAAVCESRSCTHTYTHTYQPYIYTHTHIHIHIYPLTQHTTRTHAHTDTHAQNMRPLQSLRYLCGVCECRTRCIECRALLRECRALLRKCRAIVRECRALTVCAPLQLDRKSVV